MRRVRRLQIEHILRLVVSREIEHEIDQVLKKISGAKTYCRVSNCCWKLAANLEDVQEHHIPSGPSRHRTADLFYIAIR